MDADTANRLNIDVATDTIYINFYNSYKNSNIAKFIYVYKLIDDEEFEIAEDTLNAIIDTNKYESYSKAVLEIYLQKIITGESMSNSDSLILEEISNECVMLGGPAVYEARAILNVDIFDTCLTGGSRIRDLWAKSNLKIPGEIEFDVHPNPTSGYLTIINKSEIESQEVIFVLREITGRELKRFPLNHFSFSINLFDFSQGLFFYEIYVDRKLIQTDKIIISR